MDRALQERIIGALVLVVIVVLVVPVFLDGPSDDAGTINETVTLPGQNGQARKQQTIVLERDRAEPVPANGIPTPAPAQEKEATQALAKKPEPAKPEPAPADTRKVAATEQSASKLEKTVPPAEEPVASRKAEPKPPVTNTSTTGMWAVQLGSFSNQANAEKLAADLRKNGYAAFLSQLKTSSGQMQRVRIGPQKDRDSAEAVAAKLQAAGHKGQVVPHP